MSETKESDVYKSLLHLMVHAENTSWNRFNIFLVFNSILLLASATLIAGDQFLMRGVVLTLFCIIGAAGGILWAALGYRGRKFHDNYLSTLRKFEEQHMVQLFDKALLPGAVTSTVRDGFSWSNLGSSFALLICFPLVFSGLYVFLLWVPLK